MDLQQLMVTTDPYAAAVTAAPAHLSGSGSLDDQPFPCPALEDYRASLPQELCLELSKLVQDLEQQREGSSRFDAKKICEPLREHLYDFLYQQNLGDVQHHLLHELPRLEEFDMPDASGFLLRPPQPTSKTETAASSASSRQRVAKVDPGQQSRNFNSYNSNKPLALSSYSSRSLLFVTSPCKDQGGNTIGLFRCWVCADASEQQPDNGHDWKWVKLLKEGNVQPQAWVDVSVGLGVLEPQVPQRKRSRSGSAPSSSSFQGPAARSSVQPVAAAERLQASTPSAAGPVADSMTSSGMQASAALQLSGMWSAQQQHLHAQAGLQHAMQPNLGIGPAAGLPAPGQLPAGQPQHSLPRAATLQAQMLAGTATGVGSSQHPQELQPQQQQLLPPASAFVQVQSIHSGPHVASTPAGGLASAITQMGMSQHAMPAPCVAMPLAVISSTLMPLSPAYAAAPPPAAAQAPMPADLSDLVNQLQQLELDKHVKQLGALLQQAARTGGDLLQCFMLDNTSSALQQQQHERRQQAQQQMVHLLTEHGKSSDLVDKHGRNLLHLVATHSFGVPLQMRQQQLDLLLGSDRHLAVQLMQAHNSNSCTPLMVAASGIKDEAHAAVFQRLLQAADLVVLASTSKSGWSLLHRLAHDASEAREGSQVRALLCQLMHEVLARMQQLTAELSGQGNAQQQMQLGTILQSTLYSKEPTDRFYKGHCFVQQLQQEVQSMSLPWAGC